jgi:hypothetical protein
LIINFFKKEAVMSKVMAFLVAVVAGLISCAGDTGANSGGGGSSGGNVVGEWLLLSTTVHGMPLDTSVGVRVMSLKSSGECLDLMFHTIGDSWYDLHDLSGTAVENYSNTWHTVGSTMYMGESGVVSTYNISDSELTFAKGGIVSIWTKIDLDSWKRSHGL